mmetsp:Transcript_19698/g.45861  ORF Transcript_19698/g.45861 Transcript_19698/m.45861 type:complete len:135 (+) Transcript_19698:1698-2102(+)
MADVNSKGSEGKRNPLEMLQVSIPRHLATLPAHGLQSINGVHEIVERNLAICGRNTFYETPQHVSLSATAFAEAGQEEVVGKMLQRSWVQSQWTEIPCRAWCRREGLALHHGTAWEHGRSTWPSWAFVTVSYSA